MDDVMLAACGNNCHSCPRYMATNTNDRHELEAVAVLWYQCGWREKVPDIDEIKCYGCSSVQWCRYGVRECCIEKNIGTCAACAEYPCEKITQAFNRTEEYRQSTYYICDYSRYFELENAFFQKQIRLDKLHRIKTN